jgi:hypothetical protein
VGNITKIEGDKVWMVTEDKKREIIAFSSNIRTKVYDLMSKQSIKKTKLEITRFDLVQLTDNKTVGVVLYL